MGPAARSFALRVAYVASTWFLASLIPFFGSLMGLIGAIGATPTNFIIPCLLWLGLKQPKAWVSPMWWMCWGLAAVGTVLGVLGAIGAMYNIVKQSSTYQIFGG